jgi:hypothetical protein
MEPMTSSAIALVRIEYVETPGLRLTFHQAQRLCGLPSELCERALSALVGSGFLARTAGDRYIRGEPRASDRDPSVQL